MDNYMELLSEHIFLIKIDFVISFNIIIKMSNSIDNIIANLSKDGSIITIDLTEIELSYEDTCQFNKLASELYDNYTVLEIKYGKYDSSIPLCQFTNTQLLDDMDIIDIYIKRNHQIKELKHLFKIVLLSSLKNQNKIWLPNELWIIIYQILLEDIIKNQFKDTAFDEDLWQ